jgi:hypothetical protein
MATGGHIRSTCTSLGQNLLLFTSGTDVASRDSLRSHGVGLLTRGNPRTPGDSTQVDPRRALRASLRVKGTYAHLYLLLFRGSCYLAQIHGRPLTPACPGLGPSVCGRKRRAELLLPEPVSGARRTVGAACLAMPRVCLVFIPISSPTTAPLAQYPLPRCLGLSLFSSSS